MAHKNNQHSWIARWRDFSGWLSHFLNKEIWRSKNLHDHGVRGRVFALLRILSILLNGLSNNRLLNRSAALSYYSLIGMGPLVAIVVMVSGFILQRGDTNLAAQSLNKVLLFIAPTVSELTKLDSGASSADSGAMDSSSAAPDAGKVLNEDLINLINNFIEKAQSGTVGIIGALLLIVIGIRLFISIESTFNEIWGVRKGRSWTLRVVYYWTFISLGAVLGFASVTVISASTLMGLFDYLPFGSQASHLFQLLGPLFSFAAILGLLWSFYRFIPNTHVLWRPALAGAFFVTLLLILNNYLSFIYVHRVISQQSLFGSLGIIPVLMIGLYIFWFFVLLGGQITYSVQNAGKLTHREAWENVSAHTRETLSLAAFLIISRRFLACDPPVSADELSETLRVPGHILNECLGQLVDVGFVSLIVREERSGENSARYQPARPLKKVTLGEFKNSLEGYGNNEGAELIHEADPLIDYYQDNLQQMVESNWGLRNFESLLVDNSSGHSESKSDGEPVSSSP